MENVLFAITEDGDNINVQVRSNPMELAMALSIAYQNSPELKSITEMALAAVEAGAIEDIEVEKKEVTTKTQGDA